MDVFSAWIHSSNCAISEWGSCGFCATKWIKHFLASEDFYLTDNLPQNVHYENWKLPRTNNNSLALRIFTNPFSFSSINCTSRWLNSTKSFNSGFQMNVFIFYLLLFPAISVAKIDCIENSAKCRQHSVSDVHNSYLKIAIWDICFGIIIFVSF